MIMKTRTRTGRRGEDYDNNDDTNNNVIVASVVATLMGARSEVRMPSAARDFK